MAALRSRIRALPERYGRTTLILLAAVLVLGLGLRAYRVVEPLAAPGDDAHAYYALSKALYAEGSYGGPKFHDSSDWSPGAPLLYAASFYAKASRESSRRCSAWRRSSSPSRSAGGSPAHRQGSSRPSGSPSTHRSSTRPGH
jgi:hypothetical protein